jgi:hypothetical protein
MEPPESSGFPINALEDRLKLPALPDCLQAGRLLF